MTVLLVDDRANTREVYGRLLGLMNHHVLTAASGAEAKHLIDASSIDAAVIDVALGDMSGFEVLEHLRRVRPCATAVLVSASVDTGEAADRAAQPDVFLTKPLRWAELERVLHLVDGDGDERPLHVKPNLLDERLS